jgi:hypothetical protein
MTLQAYPHAAGRLQRDVKGRWHVRLGNQTSIMKGTDLQGQIKLSKSSVPLTVAASTSIVTEDMISSRPMHNDFVDPFPWTFFPLENERMSREPLVRFKLVKLVMTGETSLTVHMSHVLGWFLLTASQKVDQTLTSE